MARHTFHLGRHASSPLYNFISSSLVRVTLIFLTLLDIVLFSIGVGLAQRYISPDVGYSDLGVSNHFFEQSALGWMFLPLPWLVFLVLWQLLKKPKIHPGYYIGLDLYVGLSTITSLAVSAAFSAPLQGPYGCILYGEPGEPLDNTCAKHQTSIKNLDIIAYSLGFLISGSLLVLFAVACRVCTVYDREKAANKRLHKKDSKSTSPSSSTSLERISVPTASATLGSSGENAVLESRIV